VQRIRRARLEFGEEVEIEGASMLVFGMDEEPAASDLVVERNEPEDDVREKSGTKATAFVVFVDAETGKERDRLRISSGAATHPRRRISEGDLSHAPPVVRDDVVVIVFGDDEDLRSTRGRRLACVATQPLGLFCRTAGEALESVAVGEQLGAW
jgi:hypothetical protein